MVSCPLISIRSMRATGEGRSMSRDHLLVIDQGTTSTRAVVYDAQLQVVGQGQAEVLPTYPQSGWVEHDPGCPGPLGRAAGHPGTRRVGRECGSDRGHRPDQPAGNDDRLGARERQGDRPGPGLAGSPDRAGLRPAQGQAGRGSPIGPDWSSTPISPRPRSPGSSTTSPMPAAAPRPASWPRGRWIASSSGT